MFLNVRRVRLDHFDPRANGLNLFRLVLAASVIVWHSFPLTGRSVGWAPLQQLMADIGVDGFFAISGFLITGSWLARPRARAFLWARVLRIFPGLWTCLLVTVVIFVPVATVMAHGALPTGYPGSARHYLAKNWLLQVGDYDIRGTLPSAPIKDVWNGSLWTLRWEFLCYLGVLALGLVHLLRSNVVLVLWAACWLVSLAGAAGGIHNYWLHMGGRFGLMFLSGALLRLRGARMPVGRRWLLLAAALVLAGSFVVDYRLVAALPLAYLLIGSSIYVRSPRLQLRNDISYGVYVYGWPVQQLLIVAGVHKIWMPLYTATAVAVACLLAALSWFVVERNALRLKHRRRPPNRVPARVPAQASTGIR
jgi:peptidoglycan/LPS O-acetylase OafA/YrhL